MQTTKNKQGNDAGSQYRSVILYHTQTQFEIATRIMSEIAPAYGSKGLSTTLELFTGFYEAEEYHQDYLTKNAHGYECSTHFERTWEKIAGLYGGKVPVKTAAAISESSSPTLAS